MTEHGLKVTPELVLRAYAAGFFPMAEGRQSSRLYWLDPDQRGILPLNEFHLPRRLARTILRTDLDITVDQSFAEVLSACAAPAPGREDSWINGEVENLFNDLHHMGHAHSVEVRRSGILVGGLYGIRVGGAFFGESMFSRERETSKIALVYLVMCLRRGGFVLLDTQFLTEHLKQFGAIEIPRADYKARLDLAVRTLARWGDFPTPSELADEISMLRTSGTSSSA